MWKVFMPAALALTIGQADASTPLYSDRGELGVQQQKITVLPEVQPNHWVTAKVQGTNQNGDIDCYLIVNHRIVSKDEAGHNQCVMSYYPHDRQFVRLWIVNHGTEATQYSATVEQQ